jgi:HAMP domain-containing protein
MFAVPELTATAATNIAGIGSTLTAAHAVAAGPTTAIIPAAADEVSAGIAHLLSAQAQQFQGLAGEGSGIP